TVPRRILSAGPRKRLLVGLHVLWPQRAIGVIGLADLPLALRILETLPEAVELLVLADVQEDLDDVCPAVDQVVFEIADPTVTLRPDAFGYEVVHTHHQHVLVMRAIEDDHFPPRR